mmetsp:Transcript_24307/g.42924  ORF Transcript_24307/g.42924 Transcript_24307/m.42924 type:complete len:98 (-) Transcript_24307:38-331(-)
MIGMLRLPNDLEGRTTLAWLVSRAYNVQGLRSRDAVEAAVGVSEHSEDDSKDAELARLSFPEFNKMARRYPQVIDHLLGYLRDQASIQDILSDRTSL